MSGDRIDDQRVHVLDGDAARGDLHPGIMFPPDRRNDPMRGAEARIFDELGRSHLPGFVHYEWQRDRRSRQLDLATWLSGVGRFGLEVKGGQYLLHRGIWYLMTVNGPARKDSPVRKTWDAIMSLHDEIVDTLGHEAFFIAVLVFPDMEPDQAIADNAMRNNVHVIWGVDGLVDKLQEIAAETEVFNPPDEEDIAREVAAVTDGQVLYEPRDAPAPAPDRNPLLPLPGVPPLGEGLHGVVSLRLMRIGGTWVAGVSVQGRRKGSARGYG